MSQKINYKILNTCLVSRYLGQIERIEIKCISKTFRIQKHDKEKVAEIDFDTELMKNAYVVLKRLKL